MATDNNQACMRVCSHFRIPGKKIMESVSRKKTECMSYGCTYINIMWNAIISISDESSGRPWDNPQKTKKEFDTYPKVEMQNMKKALQNVQTGKHDFTDIWSVNVLCSSQQVDLCITKARRMLLLECFEIWKCKMILAVSGKAQHAYIHAFSVASIWLPLAVVCLLLRCLRAPLQCLHQVPDLHSIAAKWAFEYSSSVCCS